MSEVPGWAQMYKSLGNPPMTLLTVCTSGPLVKVPDPEIQNRTGAGVAAFAAGKTPPKPTQRITAIRVKFINLPESF
jgi:hypothetical protein